MEMVGDGFGEEYSLTFSQSCSGNCFFLEGENV